MGLDVTWIARGSVVYTQKKTNPWPMEPAVLQNIRGLQTLLSSSNKTGKSIKNPDLQSKQKQRDSILGEAKSLRVPPCETPSSVVWLLLRHVP